MRAKESEQEKNEEKKQYERKLSVLATLALLWSEIRNYWLLTIAAYVALVCGVMLNLAIPQIIRKLVSAPEQFTGSEFERYAPLFALLVLQGIAFFFRSYLFQILGLRVVLSLRRKLFASLSKKPIQFYDEHTSGEILSRLFSDVSSIYDLVSSRFSIFVRYSLQVLGGIVFMFMLSTKLALILLLCIPILIGSAVILGRKLKKFSIEQQERHAALFSRTEENFTLQRVIRSFSAEKHEYGVFDKGLDGLFQISRLRAAISAFFSSFVNFLLYVTLLTVIGYGLYAVRSEMIAGADLTAFLLYGAIVAISFSFLSSTISKTIQAFGATERAFSWLDLTVNLDDMKSPEKFESLEFQDVSFNYPSRPNQEILDKVSLKIGPGERVALVGSSGAGKSTILQLLMRFYDNYSGDISINGRNFREDTKIAPRCAYVPQDTQLFTATLRENLSYGSPDISDEQLTSLIERFDLAGFVESLPEGLETKVGPKGLHLSGGQRQRIAIIRALLFEPQLLLLDEATSALDRENEARVLKVLDEIPGGPAIVLVTHRIDLLQDFDRIYVFELGQLVQSGQFEALVSESGVFQEHYQLGKVSAASAQ